MQGEAPDSLRDVGGSIALVWTRIDAWIDGFYLILPNLVLGLIFLILVLIASRVTKAAVWRVGLRRKRPDLGNVLGALLQWTIGIVGTLIAITIIFPGVGVADLLGTLGITSIAIGFAFKDILQNLLAGILILLRQPFRRGDQIVSGSFEGTVESIETRATIIRTYDGRQVVIPNSDIYTGGVVINTAHDSRRSEYDVGIGYGDDIARAVHVIVEAIKDAEGVLPHPPPEAFPVAFADSAVKLRVWWWTAPDRITVWRTHGRVLEAIKVAFRREGIDLPFPVTTLLFHDQTDESDGDRERQREGWPAGSDPPKPRNLPRALERAKTRRLSGQKHDGPETGIAVGDWSDAAPRERARGTQ
jgi:small-conductance mechanosensitive channel